MHVARARTHRVSGREDAAEEHGRLPAPAVEEYVARAGEPGANKEPGAREEERVLVNFLEDVPVDGEGRLEEERRQEEPPPSSRRRGG